MIIIRETDVYGFEPAIRGMRNAKKSWGKSDSGLCEMWSAPVEDREDQDRDDHYYKCSDCIIRNSCSEAHYYVIGKADHQLAGALAIAGPEHAKYLRMIQVWCDITAPAYWWQEMDTYKVGTTANSTSLQHTGASREFVPSDFCCENLGKVDKDSDTLFSSYADDLEDVISVLNDLRAKYVETKDYRYFKAMRELMPMGYMYTRTWNANYAVLRTIYHQRKDHALKEWKDFCRWVEDLPYSYFITAETRDDLAWINAVAGGTNEDLACSYNKYKFGGCTDE